MFVPIASIDPLKQLVTFTDYVYLFEAGDYLEPTLAIQTAVNILNAATNQLECFTKIVPVPGAGPVLTVQNGFDNTSTTLPQMSRRTDVQMDVTSAYGAVNNLLGFGLENTDAIARANFYLAGMLQPYIPSAAQTLEYNGIVPLACDGAITQVTWSVGGQGATTTASLNTEHDVNIPPYPARRRREYLPPIKNDRVNLTDPP